MVVFQMDLLSNDFIYLLAQSQNSGGIGSLFSLVFALAVYAFGAYCFQEIYTKLGEPNAWFAWVPFLNIWIAYKAGGISPWWIIGVFIPIVNLVASIMLIIAFVNVVKKLGKNPWLILLMIIPLVNFWVIYHFAFG